MDGGSAQSSRGFLGRINALACIRALIVLKLIANVLVAVSAGAVLEAQRHVKLDAPYKLFLAVYCVLNIAQTISLYLRSRIFFQIHCIKDCDEDDVSIKYRTLDVVMLVWCMVGYHWAEKHGARKEASSLLYYTSVYCIMFELFSFCALPIIGAMVVLVLLVQYWIAGFRRWRQERQIRQELQRRREWEQRQREQELAWRQHQIDWRRRRLGEQEWGRRQRQAEQGRQRYQRQQQWHQLSPGEQRQQHREQEQRRLHRQLQQQQRRQLWRMLPQEEQERQRQLEQEQLRQRLEQRQLQLQQRQRLRQQQREEQHQEERRWLQQFTTVSYLSEDDIFNGNCMCSICSDGYIPGDEIALLPCHHNFHAGCICMWLRVQKSCPLCRKRIVLDTSP
ncbi:hypothetical protein PAPHI01_1512 [Pancytospora philotis]|nr:hypothetical protein PAPHI01_1512 [Pancytospora philotis]